MATITLGRIVRFFKYFFALVLNKNIRRMRVINMAGLTGELSDFPLSMPSLATYAVVYSKEHLLKSIVFQLGLTACGIVDEFERRSPKQWPTMESSCQQRIKENNYASG